MDPITLHHVCTYIAFHRHESPSEILTGAIHFAQDCWHSNDNVQCIQCIQGIQDQIHSMVLNATSLKYVHSDDDMIAELAFPYANDAHLVAKEPSTTAETTMSTMNASSSPDAFLQKLQGAWFVKVGNQKIGTVSVRQTRVIITRNKKHCT